MSVMPLGAAGQRPGRGGASALPPIEALHRLFIRPPSWCASRRDRCVAG